MYDELQFTFGEGPCLDSVSAAGFRFLVVDLADPEEARWPAYGPAMLAHQIRGVTAIPIVVAGEFCRRPRSLPRAAGSHLLAEDLDLRGRRRGARRASRFWTCWTPI